MHEEVKNTFDWKCFNPQEGCISVDCSKCHITSIPNEILGKLINIRFLYLEGNHMTELDTAFFPTLRELRWLDLRNNKLIALPNSIMDHPSLQVLLLEGNKLETIPVEIGSVDTLRGLQLARNPIKYPPPNIINQGVQHTIEFLRKQWQQTQSPQQIQLISETHSQNKTVSAKLKYGPQQKRMGGSKSAVALRVTEAQGVTSDALKALSAANLSKCISVQPISRHRQPPAVHQVFSPVVYEKKSHHLAKKSCAPQLHQSEINRNSTDMQAKLMRDIWIEKVREMLLKQEAILQRRRNAEALQQWQDETKVLQQTQPKKGGAEINFPYDTDPEFLKVLSRKDLKEDCYKRRDSSPHKTRHEEPINNKIMSIMAALQELQTSQSLTSMSPRSEQRVLSDEIKKIRELQRSLNALKLKNFGQLGFLS